MNKLIVIRNGISETNGNQHIMFFGRLKWLCKLSLIFRTKYNKKKSFLFSPSNRCCTKININSRSENVKKIIRINLYLLQISVIFSSLCWFKIFQKWLQDLFLSFCFIYFQHLHSVSQIVKWIIIIFSGPESTDIFRLTKQIKMLEF